MQIKSILAGAAMALAAGIGTATAADQFTTLAGIAAQPLTVDAVENPASNPFAALEGITAEAMTTRELGSVVGGDDDMNPQLVGPLSPGGPHISPNACFGVFITAGRAITNVDAC